VVLGHIKVKLAGKEKEITFYKSVKKLKNRPEENSLFCHKLNKFFSEKK
jgi:hypothetical protein